MASMAEMISGVRTYLRDFPVYFEVDEGPLNVLTVRLPHPLIDGSTLQVYIVTPPVPPATESTTALTTSWELDERNGLLKITDEAYLGKGCIVAGYHYTWFADIDLAFHLQAVLAEMAYGRDDITMQTLPPVYVEVIELGAIVHALWSLALELSLDIDVSTPEGMFIPARQRYQQVLQMMQYWENEYNDKAAMLNIGLNALEIFRLRRVAYLTGRYVPVYREREFDDPRPPERLYPPIPYGVPRNTSEEVVDVIEAWTAASVATTPPVEELER